jgi:hypothetical protein
MRVNESDSSGLEDVRSEQNFSVRLPGAITIIDDRKLGMIGDRLHAIMSLMFLLGRNRSVSEEVRLVITQWMAKSRCWSVFFEPIECHVNPYARVPERRQSCGLL